MGHLEWESQVAISAESWEVAMSLMCAGAALGPMMLKRARASIKHIGEVWWLMTGSATRNPASNRKNNCRRVCHGYEYRYNPQLPIIRYLCSEPLLALYWISTMQPELCRAKKNVDQFFVQISLIINKSSASVLSFIFDNSRKGQRRWPNPNTELSKCFQKNQTLNSEHCSMFIPTLLYIILVAK